MDPPKITDRNILNGIQESTLVHEIAGMDEVGIKSPRGRLPGKTYLPKVLLTSNPLMDRDLQKKLHNITANQLRRERTLEWNQRHFLVSQIFDGDYNLRFTTGSKSYADMRSQSAEKRNRREVTDSRSTSAHVRHDVTKLRTSGLGIFMPPLHPSQRLIEKQKIPQASPNAMFSGFSNSKQSLLSEKEQKRNIKTSNGKNKESTQQSLPTLYRSTSQITGISAHLPEKDSNSPHKTVQIRTKPEIIDHPQPGKMEKSLSLPNFKVYNPIIEVDIEKGVVTESKSENKTAPKRDKTDKLEVLCEDDVVTKLTRTLPISLMIKANQNINKEVEKRKSVMIARCKKARDVRTLEDPRWQKLETVLLDGHTQLQPKPSKVSLVGYD